MADDHLENYFDQAANYLRNIVGKLETEQLLYFYARFKQVKEGPCAVPRPGFFDFQGKQKWDAWNKLGQKDRKDAMLEYINELSRIDPDWEDKTNKSSSKGSAGLGLAVSTMTNCDDFIEEADKTVFDWCKEGNVDKLRLMLDNQKENINTLDDKGMALLHWACDRGHIDVINFLISHDADINIQDIDGQSPLHYAVSCEYITVVQLLLHHGADRKMRDNDGQTPVELTENSEIIQFLTT